jgi:hypothetical protein
MFTLTIETTGASFAGGAAPLELERILREMADPRFLSTFLPVAAAGVPVIDSNGNTCGRWSYVDEHEHVYEGIDRGQGATCWCGVADYPEGTTATCVHCGSDILLDQREGGGPGKDWGASPEDWTGNGGGGMDYGCGGNPASDEDGTAGHEPQLDTIEVAR